MLKNHPTIRLGLYLAGIVCAVAAPFINVASPDYGAAVVAAGGVFTAAALGVAASNRDEKPSS